MRLLKFMFNVEPQFCAIFPMIELSQRAETPSPDATWSLVLLDDY